MKKSLTLFFLICSFSTFAQNITCYGVGDGLKQPKVESIAIAKDGRLYIAYNTRNQGLSYFENGNFVHLSYDSLYTEFAGNNLAIDSSGNLYYTLVGISEKIIKFNGTNFDTLNKAAIGFMKGSHLWLHIDKQNEMWLGMTTGLSHWDGDTVINYTTSNGLPFDKIAQINSDQDGRILICSYSFENQGIAILNDSNIWKHIKKPEIPALNISSISSGNDGDVWVGLLALGASPYALIRMKKDNYQTYGTSDGIPENGVRTIFKDREGRMWVGTRAGLAMFENEKWYSLTMDDGLNGNNISTIIQHPSEDKIWVSTNEGVCEIDASKSWTSRLIEKQRLAVLVSQNMLMIRGDQQIKHVRIISSSGKIVQHNPSYVHPIDLSLFASGIYIIEAEIEGKLLRNKVYVE